MALDDYLGYYTLSLSADAVLIYAQDKMVAIALRRYCKELAKWAEQFQRKVTRIFFPNCGDKYFEIPSILASSTGSEGDDLNAIATKEDALEDLRILERLINAELPSGLCNLETDKMIWANPALINLCQRPADECCERNVKTLWEDAGAAQALEEIKHNLQQGSRLENFTYTCYLNPPPNPLHDFRSDFEAIWLPGRKTWARFVTIRQAEPVSTPV